MPVTVGLDIGGTAVRAAAVDSAKGGRILRRFAEMPLPAGAVASGDIVDEAAVAEAVTDSSNGLSWAAANPAVAIPIDKNSLRLIRAPEIIVYLVA